MKTIQTNNHTLKLLSGDIHQMKESENHNFSMAILLESGLPTKTSDLDAFMSSMYALIDKPEEMYKKLYNLHLGLTYNIKNISPRTTAFLSLIKEVDGEPLDVNDSQKLESLRKELDEDDFKYGVIYETTENVKKKFLMNYEETSPTS